MQNPEIIIEALTSEIASLKCKHRDDIERVRMERREIELSMTDQIDALKAFVFFNEHQGSAVAEMLESFTMATINRLRDKRQAVKDADTMSDHFFLIDEDIRHLNGIKMLVRQAVGDAEETEHKKIIENIISLAC